MEEIKTLWGIRIVYVSGSAPDIVGIVCHDKNTDTYRIIKPITFDCLQLLTESSILDNPTADCQQIDDKWINQEYLRLNEESSELYHTRVLDIEGKHVMYTFPLKNKYGIAVYKYMNPYSVDGMNSKNWINSMLNNVDSETCKHKTCDNKVKNNSDEKTENQQSPLEQYTKTTVTNEDGSITETITYPKEWAEKFDNYNELENYLKSIIYRNLARLDSRMRKMIRDALGDDTSKLPFRPWPSDEFFDPIPRSPISPTVPNRPYPRPYPYGFPFTDIKWKYVCNTEDRSTSTIDFPKTS